MVSELKLCSSPKESYEVKAITEELFGPPTVGFTVTDHMFVNYFILGSLHLRMDK